MVSSSKSCIFLCFSFKRFALVHDYLLLHTLLKHYCLNTLPYTCRHISISPILELATMTSTFIPSPSKNCLFCIDFHVNLQYHFKKSSYEQILTKEKKNQGFHTYMYGVIFLKLFYLRIKCLTNAKHA